MLFWISFQSGNLGKLNKRVRFPEVLNLAPYMSRMGDNHPPIYQLYAVAVHLNMANSAYSGHYISYVKDLHGEWFKIDDSRVRSILTHRFFDRSSSFEKQYVKCSFLLMK